MCSPREAKACDLCISNDRSMKKTDSQWVRLLYGGTGADSVEGINGGLCWGAREGARIFVKSIKCDWRGCGIMTMVVIIYEKERKDYYEQ